MKSINKYLYLLKELIMKEGIEVLTVFKMKMLFKGLIKDSFIKDMNENGNAQTLFPARCLSTKTPSAIITKWYI